MRLNFLIYSKMNPYIILVIIISLLGLPLGLWLAKLTKEELKQGKRWFKLIILVCIIAIMVSLIYAKGETLLFLILSFVFIIFLTLPSLFEQKRKKKLKKKVKKKR